MDRSGRCEGYQIQVLAFPAPDGCDTIGEGDGTETDAFWEEVDTISVLNIGGTTKFSDSLLCTQCARRGGQGSAFYYVRVVGRIELDFLQ